MEEEAREMEIERDLKKKIKKTVKKILQKSSLYQMTEMKVRNEASSQLNLDLSEDPYKFVVREAVDSFIEETIKKLETLKRKIGNRRDEEEESQKEKERAHEQKMDVDGEDAEMEKTKKKKSSKAFPCWNL